MATTADTDDLGDLAKDTGEWTSGSGLVALGSPLLLCATSSGVQLAGPSQEPSNSISGQTAATKSRVRSTHWHFDDGDFLAGTYPRTRAQATAELVRCRALIVKEFGTALAESARLVDNNNRIVAREVDLSRPCTFVIPLAGRAKCDVYQAFGRVLHAGPDFYSHSNYSDLADPTKPISKTNPPGLGLPGASPFLNLLGPAPAVPPALATGCFSVLPSALGCRGRITHDTLNKHNGPINPTTGKAGPGTTPRGKIANNFQAAVTGAIAETRRQWNDLAKALVAVYGATRGGLMICALTHDDPVRDCQNTLLAVPYAITLPPHLIYGPHLDGHPATAPPPRREN